MAELCKECGCVCKQCYVHKQKFNDMHLHVEIEDLRQRLVEKDHHIVTMETQFLNEAEKFPNGQLASMKEELFMWQDKYARLCEAHKRLQKVNQNLEDKLLKIVDKCETEKGAFTKDIATLSHRLADANYTIHKLTQDNEKYRNDVNLAIQLLQCKPSNFVGQKYESLPVEVQAKVRSYVTQKNQSPETTSTEFRSITVPISTFPPTAMVYNIAKPTAGKQLDNAIENADSKPPVDTVSVAIVARILEEREREKIYARHCNTCTCHRNVLKIDTETQTVQMEEKDVVSRASNNTCKQTKNEKERTKAFPSSNDHGRFIDSSNISAGKSYLNMRNANKMKNSSTEPEKSSQEMQNFDDQNKIDLINERLWKNNWTNTKKSLNTESSELHLDVINERIWKNSNSSNSSSSCFNQVISSDDSPTYSEKANVTEKNEKKEATSKEERLTAGPRNCLMRMTPGSKNILLDNVNAYQTVLYTSSTNKPNTALVHLAKASRSDRSASISSEETTRSECDTSSEDSNLFNQTEHLPSSFTSKDINFAGQDSTNHRTNVQKDLMTFESSSDEEHKQGLAYISHSNISEELEKTYMKLASEFHSSNLQFTNPGDIDVMTLEKYRNETKRSQKLS